ncbi:MAG: hypothetical protein Q7R70_00765 [Candidatus Diapherotrites archaeon]|nr:hypothetical protein [Candidatus Diapherotrites archaeon]
MAESLASVNVLHYPRLDTILMVEDFVLANSGLFKKKALWESLPKKMMYQTFCVIFDYLVDSKKIAKDNEDFVVWIFDSKQQKKAGKSR